jgi:hypothetical protein
VERRSVDLRHQREVVDAFFAATHHGNFEALLAVLDPDMVMRADRAVVPAGAATKLRGAAAVAKRALAYGMIAAIDVAACPPAPTRELPVLEESRETAPDYNDTPSGTALMEGGSECA